MDAVPNARRGYSRDHRPDCKQLVLALVVTPEGFPLSYELFAGNRLDRTTLEHILDTIEKKFGKARRLWVFARGIVSEDNLQLLRERGAHYRVGTPRSQLKAYEQPLLTGDWQKVSESVQVQLIPEIYCDDYLKEFVRVSAGAGLVLLGVSALLRFISPISFFTAETQRRSVRGTLLLCLFRRFSFYWLRP